MSAGPGDVIDETLDAGTRPAENRELAAGSRLGKYKLDRVLGSGGMGVVWAAHDPDLERAVALKVLRFEQAGPELRQRLLREARAMAKLKHPNVLTVYEVGSEGDRDFIAMELVEGASLDEWIASKPAREDIWTALIGAGRGLAAAHRAGLVHRDFKPHNVLRGSDGRVLVTDFGLARGHGDEAQPAAPAIALTETLPIRHGIGLEATMDVANTPTPAIAMPNTGALTRTGAVLGTPAYMAPEQFLGAASDPRTDQFAYCVTAWQLLTGERPFRGDTLDELRKSASGGVTNVKGDLPGAVRAVLARGLEADPADRWPDMNALLAALERAKGRTRRRVQLAIAVIAVAVIGVVAVKLVRAPSKVVADASTCEASPEDELAKAWTPEQRAKLLAKFNNDVGAEMVAREVDSFAATWIDSYRRACTGARNPHTYARLGCLLGQRDIVGGIAELVPTVPQNVMSQIEMGGVLPRPQACEGPSPVAAPMPEDPELRAKLKELRPKLIAVRWEQPPRMVLAKLPDLLKQAEALGWEPLIAEAHLSWGIAGERANEWEVSRDHYKAAFDIARRSHHDQLAAESAVAVLFGEVQAASDPTNGSAFEELATQARLATKTAGDDSHYRAQILQQEGENAGAHGRFDEAIAKLDQAYEAELAIHNVGYASRLRALQAPFILRRDRPGDVDDAWKRLLDAIHTAEAAKQPPDKLIGVANMARYVAQVRGDLEASHAMADRMGKPRLPPDAIAIAGRVVGADGKGVAGATVVAWTGELAGDATRVYTDRFLGDIATTAADGAFTVHGVRSGAIIAELGDQRSAPRVIGTGDVVIALAPTRTITTKVACDDEVVTGIVALAHYPLGKDLAWDVVAPVARTHELRLAGLPAGSATLRLANALDPNQPVRKLDAGPLDTAIPRWPTGPTLDVIVRGPKDANIFVFRERKTAKTRADLERMFDSDTDVIQHPALVIGIGDETPEGQKLYQRNDQHGVLLANRPGIVTVCAAERKPEAPAVCKQIEIPKVKASIVDGHGQYPTIAVLLQP